MKNKLYVIESRYSHEEWKIITCYEVLEFAESKLDEFNEYKNILEQYRISIFTRDTSLNK